VHQGRFNPLEQRDRAKVTCGVSFSYQSRRVYQLTLVTCKVGSIGKGQKM
jgi:hypothetical protein